MFSSFEEFELLFPSAGQQKPATEANPQPSSGSNVQKSQASAPAGQSASSSVAPPAPHIPAAARGLRLQAAAASVQPGISPQQSPVTPEALQNGLKQLRPTSSTFFSRNHPPVNPQSVSSTNARRPSLGHKHDE